MFREKLRSFFEKTPVIHYIKQHGSSTLNRGGVRLQRKQGSRHTSSWDAPQHNQERRMVMDPTTTFCPNLACPARGQIGQGNIGILRSETGASCVRSVTRRSAPPKAR